MWKYILFVLLLANSSLAVPNSGKPAANAGGGGGGGSGAPTGAEYITGATDATLTSERVCTDSVSVDCDMSIPGQANFHVNANSITDIRLRDSAGVSVIGRSAGTTGDPGDITAGADNHVLRRSGGALGFGTLDAASIGSGSLPDSRVDNNITIDEPGIASTIARDTELPTASTLSGVGAGTDLTSDLEEETHASEHQHAGADEIATATPGANVIPKAGAGSVLADGFIDGSAEADEVVLAGDTDGTANANDFDEAATETEIESVVDLADLQGVLPLAKLTDDATAGLCLQSGGAGGDPVYSACPGAGGGDSIRVEDGDDTGTYTAATEADFGDSGDVNVILNTTPSPDEITADVRPNKITHAKYQDIATDRLLGRDTAASGDPEELTVNGGLEFTGAGGIQRSALTGEVTASAGSNATTIADAVTTDDWTTTDHQVDTAQLTYGLVSDTPSANQNDYSPTGWNGTHPSKSTIIRVDPSATIQITGIAGGADGRILQLMNATDPNAADARLIILPHESSSSTAANRFLFPNRQAYFLFPGETVEFVYDGTDSRWRPLNFNNYADVFTEAWSDLAGANVAQIGNTQTSGTGASCQVGTYLLTSLTQNPFGELECDSGTTATGRAGVSAIGTTTGFNPEEGAVLSLTRIAVEVLSTAGVEDYEILTGFSDGVATQPLNSTDGVYWLYDVDASASWRGCSEDNTTQNCATTGPTVDTNFIWLGLFINGDWSRVDYFYSTDGVAWTIGTAETTDTNIPDGADSLTWVPVVIVKETGTTQRDVNIDTAGLRATMIRGS